MLKKLIMIFLLNKSRMRLEFESDVTVNQNLYKNNVLYKVKTSLLFETMSMITKQMMESGRNKN